MDEIASSEDGFNEILQDVFGETEDAAVGNAPDDEQFDALNDTSSSSNASNVPTCSKSQTPKRSKRYAYGMNGSRWLKHRPDAQYTDDTTDPDFVQIFGYSMPKTFSSGEEKLAFCRNAYKDIKKHCHKMHENADLDNKIKSILEKDMYKNSSGSRPHRCKICGLKLDAVIHHYRTYHEAMFLRRGCVYCNQEFDIQYNNFYTYHKHVMENHVNVKKQD